MDCHFCVIHSVYVSDSINVLFSCIGNANLESIILLGIEFFDDFSALLKSLTSCCIQRRNFLKLGYSSTIKSVMKCTMHFSTISSSRQRCLFLVKLAYKNVSDKGNSMFYDTSYEIKRRLRNILFAHNSCSDSDNKNDNDTILAQ